MDKPADRPILPEKMPRELAPVEVVQAAERLENADVVAIPTETVYGLAARIDRPEGLKKIFAVKSRPFFDPLIVHVATIKEARNLTDEWPPLADFLARVFWPGPLTLILKKRATVDSLISSGLETVGVRIPRHPLTQRLLKVTGPLAAPSANLFGRTSPSSADHVRDEFGDTVMILDGGPCEIGLESTVLRIENECTIQVLRPGGVTQEMLEDALRKWSQSVTFAYLESKASPGHTEHHYMPKIPLIILDQVPIEFQKDENFFNPHDERLPKLIMQRLALQYPELQKSSCVRVVLPDDATLAARTLYSALRDASEKRSAKALALLLTNKNQHDHWTAIRDRLKRAASLWLDWN